MIEIVSDENFDEVLPLIRAYQDFYRVSNIDEQKNRNHFGRFLRDHSRGVLLLLRFEQTPIGFATIYYTFSSARAEEVGVLNDLYVAPEYRGKGFGRQLIARASEEVKARGLTRIQWLTTRDNNTAQTLYDSTAASKSEWFFYAMDV
jgi:GNAT superfamily N-acetyltransferase